MALLETTETGHMFITDRREITPCMLIIAHLIFRSVWKYNPTREQLANYIAGVNFQLNTAIIYGVNGTRIRETVETLTGMFPGVNFRVDIELGTGIIPPTYHV